MTLNRLKLERAVTFMKYLASVVSLTFLAKILIWNKPTLNLINLAELVEHEPVKSIYQKICKTYFFCLIYHWLT